MLFDPFTIAYTTHKFKHIHLYVGLHAEKMRKLPLICLLLFITSANTSTQHVFYIKPTADSPCPYPASDCQTLQYYFIEVQSLWIDYLISLPSDSTLYFLPGTHTVDLPGIVTLSKAHNITLSGIETSPSSSSHTLNATVRCMNRTAFILSGIHSLTIRKLSFINCGTLLFPDDPNTGAALAFFSMTDLTISEVQVKNSTGYGITCFNVLGDVVILKSELLDNSGKEQIDGGNLFISYYITEQDCLTASSESVTVSIQSSRIINGNTIKSSLYSPGLHIQLFHSCVDITIDIGSMTISGNGKSSSQNSFGNLLLNIIEPHNSVGTHHILIWNSHITDGVASDKLGAGGVTVIVGNDVQDLSTIAPCRQNILMNSLKVLGSEISMNRHTHPFGTGGVVVSLSNMCQKYIVDFSGVTFVNNMGMSGPGFAGNMEYALSSAYATIPSPVHILSMKDCTVISGKGFFAGGLYVDLDISTLLGAQVSGDALEIPWVKISNTMFINNTGFYGGAVLLRVASDGNIPQGIVHLMQMEHCTLIKNIASGGSAVFVTGVTGYSVKIERPSFSIVFDQVLFSTNKIVPGITLFGDYLEYFTPPNSSIDVLERYASNDLVYYTASVTLLHSVFTTFHNCHFQDNNSTALAGYPQSYILFDGKVTFSGNRAKRGAGIALSLAYAILVPNTHVYFEDNYAEEVGGAIYINDQEVILHGYPCLFYPIVPVDLPLENADIRIYFDNNTAGIAGSALYIDNCYSSSLLTSIHTDINSPIWDYPPSLVYNLTLNYTSETGLSVISSDPLGVCYCDESNTFPNCFLKAKALESFPGQIFNVSAVAVGQKDGVVPSTVYAIFKITDTPNSYSLDKLQESQPSGTGCTNLTFKVYSSTIDTIQIILTVEDPEKPKQPLERTLFSPPLLSVTLSPCPLGFNLSGTPPKCRCVSRLKEHGITCDIDTQRISRLTGVWIGYYPQNVDNVSALTQADYPHGILFHQHCPFDYCKPEDVQLLLRYPDEQCAHHRSGTLCGTCQHGYSIVLGSSSCLQCSNSHIALLLAFIASGIALVIFLTLCNLTISDGTLSAIIFYANIVQINNAIFLTGEGTSVFTIFIAWLNLDLGIPACFYHGMDMYAKAWLQFVYPLYIWTIVLTMIVSSHYSSRAARIFSRNAPKVLATLFMLSYAKLLRAVITVFSFTFLDYPDGTTKTLWLYDGNVVFLRGKHIPLFMIACVVCLAFLLPYTVICLFAQCLQRINNYRVRNLLRRLKPIIDAHVGPYKDKYRFWPGLLLLTRVILFLAFALNSLGDVNLNLLLITIVVVAVICLELALRGVYKAWSLDILDAVVLLNLVVLSSLTWYVQTDWQSAVTVPLLSVMSAIFAGVLLLHICARIMAQRTRNYNASELQNFFYVIFQRLGVRQHGNTDTELQNLENVDNSDSDAETQNLLQPHGDQLEQMQPQSQPQPRGQTQGVPCQLLTFDRDHTSGEAVLIPHHPNPASVQKLEDEDSNDPSFVVHPEL